MADSRDYIRADCAAVIAAGGSGVRMGGEVPKQFLELAGVPLLIHSLRAFAAVAEIGPVVVSTKAEYLEHTRELLDRHGFSQVQVVAGGASRQESVANGLAALAAAGGTISLVAVHDGARPLVEPELIRRCLAAARHHGAAIAATPVRDTLKRAISGHGVPQVAAIGPAHGLKHPSPSRLPQPAVPRDRLPCGSSDLLPRPVSAPAPADPENAPAATYPPIAVTVDREGLWQAQTPQVADFSLLRQALQEAAASGFVGTDEASLLENLGARVVLVPAGAANLKITHPDDLTLAEALLNGYDRPGQQVAKPGDQLSSHAAPGAPSIGHGYDVHRLVPDRKLILGGVEIPHHLGLLGHSDADVLTHALCDAILGALGAGDIGRHFPDNDPQYRGIASLKLLARVMEQAWAVGRQLSNADLTIIAQRPKLAPHLAAIQANLAATCRVSPTKINLKATTTEGLGFAGREEGIAAHAVVLLT